MVRSETSSSAFPEIILIFFSSPMDFSRGVHTPALADMLTAEKEEKEEKYGVEMRRWPRGERRGRERGRRNFTWREVRCSDVQWEGLALKRGTMDVCIYVSVSWKIRRYSFLFSLQIIDMERENSMIHTGLSSRITNEEGGCLFASFLIPYTQTFFFVCATSSFYLNARDNGCLSEREVFTISGFSRKEKERSCCTSAFLTKHHRGCLYIHLVPASLSVSCLVRRVWSFSQVKLLGRRVIDDLYSVRIEVLLPGLTARRWRLFARKSISSFYR